jgi:hypothetical protein
MVRSTPAAKGKKKASVATASRCTGAPAPRRNLKSGKKAKVKDDEEMAGVEETPLPTVNITIAGQPYDAYEQHDRVGVTLPEQCNLLTPVVVLQRLSGPCRSQLPFVSPELVLQMHHPHHYPAESKIYLPLLPSVHKRKVQAEHEPL